MAKVRVYFEPESGGVLQIEHRPDEAYTDENLLIGPEEAASVVSDVDLHKDVPNVPFSQLEVRDANLRRRTEDTTVRVGPDVRSDELGASSAAAPASDDETERRIREIREVDKSVLSNEEWLALFREYVSLTGGF
jgi:hypothetical protein